MTEKQKKALSNKAKTLSISVDKWLQKESIKNWLGKETDRFREMQRCADRIVTLIDEIKCDDYKETL